MASATFNEFGTRQELAEALSERIAKILIADPAHGNFSSIALSGGTTPKLMLAHLADLLKAYRQLVYFALVDERFVPPTDRRSNEQMVRHCLGLENHPKSEFLSLYAPNSTPQEAAKRAEEKLLADEELPFDIVVLGMGTDGHTASFFPGGDNLQAATDPDCKSLFMPMKAPGAEEPRITMTLPPIVSARNLILHIEGSDKRKVFEKALKNEYADDMPIRHVLRHGHANLQIYWAP